MSSQTIISIALGEAVKEPQVNLKTAEKT